MKVLEEHQSMSAHEIISAISAPPERLPGGLGILSVEMPLEDEDGVQKTRLQDTLMGVLERMLCPKHTPLK